MNVYPRPWRSAAAPIHGPLAALGLALVLALYPGCNAMPDPMGVRVRPMLLSASVNESTSTLIIRGLQFGTGLPGSKLTVGDVDLTGQTIWADEQLLVKGLPASGPGSEGDIEVTAVYAAGDGEMLVPSGHPLQLSAWRGQVTVVARDLVNYVGESTTGTYAVHFRACLNNAGNQENIGAQAAKDSTCSRDASGTFTGSGYIETISRNGNATLPISYATGDTLRFFDASLTLGTEIAGAGTAADPFDPRRITILFDCTARDIDGIKAVRVNTSDGAVSNYTKFYVNTGKTDAIPARLDASFNIQAGAWTSDDGSTTVTWTDIPLSSPPDRSGRTARAR